MGGGSSDASVVVACVGCPPYPKLNTSAPYPPPKQNKTQTKQKTTEVPRPPKGPGLLRAGGPAEEQPRARPLQEERRARRAPCGQEGGGGQEAWYVCGWVGAVSCVCRWCWEFVGLCTYTCTHVRTYLIHPTHSGQEARPGQEDGARQEGKRKSGEETRSINMCMALI